MGRDPGVRRPGNRVLYTGFGDLRDPGQRVIAGRGGDPGREGVRGLLRRDPPAQLVVGVVVGQPGRVDVAAQIPLAVIGEARHLPPRVGGGQQHVPRHRPAADRRLAAGRVRPGRAPPGREVGRGRGRRRQQIPERAVAERRRVGGVRRRHRPAVTGHRHQIVTRIPGRAQEIAVVLGVRHRRPGDVRPHRRTGADVPAVVGQQRQDVAVLVGDLREETTVVVGEPAVPQRIPMRDQLAEVVLPVLGVPPRVGHPHRRRR